METKQFDVVVVGELNVDLILNQIHPFPEVGKEVLAETMNLTLGSSSAIFASNLSCLGPKVSFLGMLGNDSFGKLCLQTLQQKGVDTSLIKISDTVKTGATIVMSFAEDRMNVTHMGAMEHYSIKDISDSDLQKARHMHFSSVFLQPAMHKDIITLFKRAKALGLTTSLDTQWDPNEKWDLDLKTLLPLVDVFIPNEEEIKCLTKTSTVDDAIKVVQNLGNIIAIKRGNKGSTVLYKGQQIVKAPFLNTQVVDAIGAGDSFDAGFISKFISKFPVEDCQEFANLTGAINTTAAGGTTAFSSLDAVLKVARERFGYKG